MLIKVKCFPDFIREEIIQKKEDQFEVRVKEKAQRGEANKRIVDVVADYFNVPTHKVRIIKGFREGNKIIEIKND